ncbi:MAG TPA: chemotaxis protein, partial [Sphingomonas sp.]
MIGAELDELRERGVRILALCGWLATLGGIALAVIGLAPPNPMALAVSVAVNLLPTYFAIWKRHDLVPRIVAGAMIVVHPAIVVLLLRGAPTQVDMHLFFLVALAMLVSLYDWRPIAVASLLVALDLIAPELPFKDGASLLRIAIHAAAIGAQGCMLSYVTIQLRRLIIAQGLARRQSEDLAAEAT